MISRKPESSRVARALMEELSGRSHMAETVWKELERQEMQPLLEMPCKWRDDRRAVSLTSAVLAKPR